VGSGCWLRILRNINIQALAFMSWESKGTFLFFTIKILASKAQRPQGGDAEGEKGFTRLIRFLYYLYLNRIFFRIKISRNMRYKL
jgi:hypothetical protein